jgi:hypothetical protein
MEHSGGKLGTADSETGRGFEHGIPSAPPMLRTTALVCDVTSARSTGLPTRSAGRAAR